MTEQPNSAAINALDGLAQAMLASVQPLIDAQISKEIEAHKAKIGTRNIVVAFNGEQKKFEGRTHPMFERVLKLTAGTMKAQKHIVMLSGPAGCGKTKLASDVMRALGLRFGMISGSAGVTESHLTGKLLPTGEQGKFEYAISTLVDFFENGGGFLLDEVDGMDANVLLPLNPAISNGALVVENRKAAGGHSMARRHKDFAWICAANTFGTGAGAMYVGRNQLDASFLDRAIIVHMDYDREYEAEIAPARVCDWVWNLREKAQRANLRRVVSTRTIEKMALEIDIGFDFATAKNSVLAGWSKDDLAKVGESI